MSNVSIAIGADHHGFALKSAIIAYKGDVRWIDVGADDDQPSDYPQYAAKVCHLLQKGVATSGILLCGSGIGMAIAANRFPGIYAGLVWNETIAAHAKQEDNINVLVLPADYLSEAETLAIVDVWLRTPFSAKERYIRRIGMIDSITQGE
jgi:ribose 5-phosphate isomerase B